ncbi:hypothetical protein B0T24DRAFT_529383 [Lasiosphaeria ovina]|uniref:SET domain-containing protein n=1 Tax=Lasiosphaeria ovina TaxID=92902 RepID=A0AAE0N8P0_9PEZI|nr:hypothetical protein B0T24DRAFT_529383 [Lasiosphaeria ovina]
MPSPKLPIEGLPVWAHLNNVTLTNVKIANTGDKGFGVVCDSHLTTEASDETLDTPALLTVPHDLVLNAEAVQEYAKEDRTFRELLDAVGHQSARGDILLFLLVQTALASRIGHSSAGVLNPWTEYIQFLPETVLLPTLWTEEERLLLGGTSLEAAVSAKISSLDSEFGSIYEASSNIPRWNEALWESGAVSFRDWILLDALYRSRCLELPRSGESLVPCIDMVNHSAAPTAYYDENAKDDVALLLRPGTSISEGDEISISYGDAKSAAEMLFSYGFIDPDSTVESLVLPLEPLQDDPLAKAKLFAFGEAPKVHVSRSNGSIAWRSPFAYLMCVNEEDGLEFRVLRETREMNVLWQGDDVTDQTTEFQTLVQSHPLSALFSLRVVTVVQERLQSQLDRAQPDAEPRTPPTSEPSPTTRETCVKAALLLRNIEIKILEDTIEALEEEKTTLLADEHVVAYLGSMETAGSDLVEEEASNEEDDFS